MATLETLIAEVDRVVQDDSYTSTIITGILNRAVKEIAAGTLYAEPDGTQIISGPLPELATSDTVATSTSNAYASLPTNFGRDLFQCVSSDNSCPVKIFLTWDRFLTYYPTLDMSADVVAVVVKGDYLYYQGIPTSSDTLTLYYYRLPTDMSNDSDTPDGIPSQFAHNLLVNYTAWQIFEEIYEGDDSQAAKSITYRHSRYVKALQNLGRFIGVREEPIQFGIEKE